MSQKVSQKVTCNPLHKLTFFIILYFSLYFGSLECHTGFSWNSELTRPRVQIVLIILALLSLTDISIWSGQTRGRTASCSPIYWQNRMLQNHMAPFSWNVAKSLSLWETRFFNSKPNQRKNFITAPLRGITLTASGWFSHSIPLSAFCALSFSREVFTKFTWLYWGCCHFLLNSLQFWFSFTVEQKVLFFTFKKLLPEEKEKEDEISTEDVMTECVSDQQVFPYDRSIHRKIIKWNYI